MVLSFGDWDGVTNQTSPTAVRKKIVSLERSAIANFGDFIAANIWWRISFLS
jgi:hypothetical protein